MFFPGMPGTSVTSSPKRNRLETNPIPVVTIDDAAAAGNSSDPSSNGFVSFLKVSSLSPRNQQHPTDGSMSGSGSNSAGFLPHVVSEPSPEYQSSTHKYLIEVLRTRIREQGAITRNTLVVDTRAPCKQLLPPLWSEPTPEQVKAMQEKKVHFSRKPSGKTKHTPTEKSSPTHENLRLPPATRKYVEQLASATDVVKTFEQQANITIPPPPLTEPECLTLVLKDLQTKKKEAKTKLATYCAAGRGRPVTLRTLERNKHVREERRRLRKSPDIAALDESNGNTLLGSRRVSMAIVQNKTEKLKMESLMELSLSM
eukprot:PhF_6_TR37149/c0_g1_i3/m.54683